MNAQTNSFTKQTLNLNITFGDFLMFELTTISFRPGDRGGCCCCTCLSELISLSLFDCKDELDEGASANRIPMKFFVDSRLSHSLKYSSVQTYIFIQDVRGVQRIIVHSWRRERE